MECKWKGYGDTQELKNLLDLHGEVVEEGRLRCCHTVYSFIFGALIDLYFLSDILDS